ATVTVTIMDNDTVTSTNVIDDTQDFVCQHYHDFLNRQPDASGLAFWANQITSCGTDQSCIQAKRINVSAAFFLSIEFQETGYLVERIYKTAYSDANGTSTLGGAHQISVPIVRYSEFLLDTQKIGQGVVVGQTGWEIVLENNKQAFTQDFVQRFRFTTAFPTSMTPAQYFDYLRRNPNTAPDSDYTGYDFWLTKLNQFNGNFVAAEMVKAFITSTEYRQRFGP